MRLVLNAVECRVLGCLIEKELTTPEYYPLTFNALHAACNQKSNREPVAVFEPKSVARALEDLRAKHLVWEVSVTGNRVPKYKHDLPSQCPVTPEEIAVLAELLLRGEQTAAELRNRASRMIAFAEAASMDAVLQALMAREEPLVAKRPAAPGQREPRYVHRLGDDVAAPPALATASAPAGAIAEVRLENERLAALETTVADLQAQLAELKAKLAGLLG
ncbi:MAG: YceH family protein [Lentisphaerae bacterium]|nr:YceH family protein [Lentisphaerota bacterium]